MAITISGSGITSANIADDTIVNSDINSSAAIAQSKTASLVGGDLPAGSVLQVVQATSDTATTPNTSWTDINGASVTITPSSTSSKILINFNVGGMTTSQADNISLKLLRDSTSIRVSSRYGYSTTGWESVPLSYIYLDSPSTTSSVTYKVQTKTDVDNDYRLNSDQSNNGGDNGLVMIAMEIAG